MDRQIIYPGQIPLDTDLLNAERFTMTALGALMQAVLGTSTVVDGLQCVPSAPASLSVQVLAGSVYAVQNLDANGFGSLAADTTRSIVKQGISLDTTVLTLTPPATNGQAINYLIQVAFSETDDTPIVLPYYNSANPAQAYSGPNGLGTSQMTVRRQKALISAKAGVAATAGTQTTPAPDAGYTGLYSVTVAYGATQLTSAQITQLSTAPFINPKLPAVVPAVQAGAFAYAVDTGAVNSLVVTLQPAPTSLAAGFSTHIKVANTCTGAGVTVNVNGIGAKPLVLPDGTALIAGSIKAGQVIRVTYDGASFYLQNAGSPDFGVLDTRYVIKSGDDMSGGLSMPSLRTRGAAATNRDFFGETGTTDANALARWLIRMADATAETGSNAGSDWSMARYSDAGAFIEIVLKCLRSSGVFDFARLPTIGGNPLATALGASISNQPVGSGLIWLGSSPPSGYLELAGGLISRTTYANLWTAAQASGMIVTDATWTTVGNRAWASYSQGDGSTTFRLPDFRGEFLRGFDNGRGVDISRSLGIQQAHKTEDLYAQNGGTLRHNEITTPSWTSNVAFPLNNNGINTTQSSGTKVDVLGTGETRPRNVPVMFCVKF
ncbi:hypothetical protein GCM10007036_14590 [Alsobacter metallidurans]|uniref:Phage tail collar domain-containing protein n=1 Tax=Alsobacter metallidurans TaxID=340221 RepID=A0A917MHH5_9HYPH|nr:phage tail protein [Alsobacter metallidurans]GGH14942.1 hypothetical protein GCM10007036_14590 [Alsobacter metallidurans]